jgi:hypothetical protein
MQIKNGDMMQDVETLCRTVKQLDGLKFVIPSYQRGYRWTEQEVSDLLNDINEFNTIGKQREKLFYYLQPLVVRQIDGGYEVVDGQQRLTTIYIFMKIAELEMRSVKEPYSLEYETRVGSEEYLKALSANGLLDDSNIDYHHITLARDTINKWLDGQDDRAEAVSDLRKKLNSHTRFIWYELPKNSNPIEVFTKINIGRIPLTNAELIKALLLSRDNFSRLGDIEIKKRQLEISIEWDRIERSLHNDTFWYFLSAEDMPTHIDLIFKLLACMYKKEYNLTVSDSERYFAFLVFSKKIEADRGNERDFIEIIEEIWGDVTQIFDEFCDWYDDLDKYHVVGYLTHYGMNIENIFNAVKDKNKRDILPSLKKLAKERLNIGNIDKYVSELEYSSNSKQKIKDILLLFNIASLVCKSGKQYRFPFELYKIEKWDIEHIHAIKDALPGSLENAKEYLTALKDEFAHSKGANQIVDKIEDFLRKPDLKHKECGDFYYQLREDCNEKQESMLAEDNSIGNLTLLNSDINRSYKNVTFRQKRNTIIEVDREGRFLPLCTKNIFLKYYSTDIENPLRWTEEDRIAYVNGDYGIVKTIEEFFKEVE